uniref:EAL domain-containing protein n=1 Tax=Bosea sp. NBC_00436 TaxID=2969620 RepID=A0A9E7ZIL5_9HYPH
MHDNLEAHTVELVRKPALRKLLQVAIDEGHVWPAFQPIVDVHTGNVASFEILARWGDPRSGDISPSTFIPRLERNGLIDMLSDALIDRACRAAAAWPGQFGLAFNISPTQLTNADFPQRLADTVAATGFPLDRIELEVTEASLISDDDRAYQILRELNDRGVRIAIDDFGTGYSSLARLEAFPFDKLKIDARFVHGLDGDSSKRRIAASIIGLGQSLGMIVVAEGIETAAEEAILRDLGCDLGQGWLYGKPGQAAEAQPLLMKRGGINASVRPLDASPFQQLHQLASLYDQAPVGLCFLDMDFRHVRANEHFASIHGMTSAELRGRTIFDLLEGEALQAIVDVLTKAATTDEPQILEPTFNGRELRVIHSRVLDLAGEVIGISIVTIDVTEENRLKATLVESGQRLREELEFSDAIINSLPGIFYYYDADLKLRRHNANAVKITGYNSDELKERSPLDFFAGNDEEEMSSTIQKIFERGQSQVEANLLRADGRSLPYLFTGVRIESADRAGYVGVGTDISELRQVQQNLRERNAIFEALLQTTPGGILLVDPQGRSLVHNAHLSTIWNIPEDIVANGDGRAQLAFIAGRVANPAEFAGRIAALEPDLEAVSTAPVEHIDGTVLGLYSAPIRDARGHHYGRVWVFREAN